MVHRPRRLIEIITVMSAMAWSPSAMKIGPSLCGPGGQLYVAPLEDFGGRRILQRWKLRSLSV